MAAVAGFKELRKLMRQYPGYSLEGKGTNAHLTMFGPEGNVVRLPDGRPLTLCSSPQDGTSRVKLLVKQLAALGITPTT